MKLLKLFLIAIGFAGTVSLAKAQQNPYLAPDSTWMSISGTVGAVNRDSFFLDYGDGQVIVEMDDGDRDADGYVLNPGDHVTVSGVVDDDFFESTSIEAASVYIDKLDATFYSSAIDEEDYASWFSWTHVSP